MSSGVEHLTWAMASACGYLDPQMQPPGSRQHHVRARHGPPSRRSAPHLLRWAWKHQSSRPPACQDTARPCGPPRQHRWCVRCLPGGCCAAPHAGCNSHRGVSADHPRPWWGEATPLVCSAGNLRRSLSMRRAQAGTQRRSRARTPTALPQMQLKCCRHGSRPARMSPQTLSPRWMDPQLCLC